MADRCAMTESPGAILRQVAKTGLLVAALAVLLYGVVAAVAERRHGGLLVGLLLGAPFTALLAFVVGDALRSGAFPDRPRAVRRTDRPAAFWCSIGWLVACGLATAALTAWCAAELIARTLPDG